MLITVLLTAAIPSFGQGPGSNLGSSPNRGDFFNENGQIWRSYDIRPYTHGITNTNRPEQPILEAILRETGDSAWHGEIPAVLSVSPDKVRVYHMPEIQDKVKSIVDLYVHAGSRVCSYQFRVMSVSSPSWRTNVIPYLRAINTHTPGTGAWLIAPPDLPLIMKILQDRADFQQVNTPFANVHNGQPQTINMVRQRTYIKGFVGTPDTWPGFQPLTDAVDEGYRVEFTPLISPDQLLIDAVVEIHIDKIEKMYEQVQPITGGHAGAPRTVKVQLPRIDQFRFKERFIWSSDRTLLISLGMTPALIPGKGAIAPGIPLLGAERVETLLLIQRL